MNTHDLPVSPHCQAALAAIEADPLNLPSDISEHVRSCLTCAEARVMWLAQEEAPVALVPAAYFDRLPERILRKLPTKPHRTHYRLWAAAALLVGAAALGGFWAGRMNRTPMLEATGPKPDVEVMEVPTEIPFTEGDDVMVRLQDMSPEETKALLERLRQTSKTETK